MNLSLPVLVLYALFRMLRHLNINYFVLDPAKRVQ